MTKREARQNARAMAKVNAWLATIELLDLHPHFKLDAICAATGIKSITLAAALTSAGWSRDQVRIAGRQVVLWTPPGFERPGHDGPGRPRKVQHTPPQRGTPHDTADLA